MRTAEGFKMRQLINDEGINQYQTVREAYEKAKEMVEQENPDRDELSKIRRILDNNPKGVDWLTMEEGSKFLRLYDKIVDVEFAVKPVDFGNTQIPRCELQALEKILMPINKNPETYYAENNDGNIKIYNNHVVSLIFDGFNLKAISPAIGELSELKFAMFAYNELSTLPKKIGKNKKLETLGLQYNQIIYLPQEIEALPSLLSIIVTGNKVPIELETLNMLERMKARGVLVFEH